MSLATAAAFQSIDSILDEFDDTIFIVRLGKTPPAEAEPMEVKIKLGSRPVAIQSITRWPSLSSLGEKERKKKTQNFLVLRLLSCSLPRRQHRRTITPNLCLQYTNPYGLCLNQLLSRNSSACFPLHVALRPLAASHVLRAYVRQCCSPTRNDQNLFYKE